MSEKIISPKDILLPYQRKWVDDPARFKIGNWSRQTGKSFGSAAEIVEDCLHNTGADWVVLSAGERQALEFMEKAKLWAQAYEFAISEYIEDRAAAETLMRSSEIRWANGRRIIALPANPATCRGYSANLMLDEFAHHEKPAEIWRAIYPSISNPLKGKLKLRVVSTPNGRANKFYDLWTKNPNYSKHKVTIFNARDQGLPIDIEELKAGLDDPDAWDQEYLCEFIDAAGVLLPYELIATCENENASETFPDDYQAEQFFTGIDIGRKRDLTVAWTLARVNDLLWTCEILCLEKTPYHEQMEILRPRIARSTRCAIDANGIGSMLAEEFGREFGGYRVMECQTSNPFKNKIYLALKRKLEDRLIRIPVSRAVREDLHALRKSGDSAGNTIRITAPHTADGHSDRASALALAIEASSSEAPAGMPVVINSARTRIVAARRIVRAARIMEAAI